MTDRQDMLEEFDLYLGRLAARGRCELSVVRDKKLAGFKGHLYDGYYGKGLRGPALYKYARNRTCGFNPLLWIQLLSLLWQIYEFWVEWRNKRETTHVESF